tara:strand:- start:3471 stop:4370 length:900 start_codon:yes stop_codon:yes gene_type:complete
MKRSNFIKKFLIFASILLSVNSPINAKEEILKIGAIPDQNQEILDRRFKLLSKELSKTLKVKVRYIPVINYVGAISAFRTKGLDLAWFGGLSGVQARLQTPNSIVIAQREIDKRFKSVFILNRNINLNKTDNIKDLKSLADLRFTFGSENSTSGRLMPEYFLNIAGVEITDFKYRRVGFSGSHDATIALVNSGTFEAGALNKQVWDRNLKNNTKRVENVKIFFITPEYSDYHWLAQGYLDKKFYKGFTDKLKAKIINLNINIPEEKKILEMFNTQKFIESDVTQYEKIESIGRKLNKIR